MWGFLCFIKKEGTKKLHNTTSGPSHRFCIRELPRTNINFKEKSAGTNLPRGKKDLDTGMNSAQWLVTLSFHIFTGNTQLNSLRGYNSYRLENKLLGEKQLHKDTARKWKPFLFWSQNNSNLQFIRFSSSEKGSNLACSKSFGNITEEVIHDVHHTIFLKPRCHKLLSECKT